MLQDISLLNAALQSHEVLGAVAPLPTRMESFPLKKTCANCKQTMLNPTSPANFSDLQSYSASSNLPT